MLIVAGRAEEKPDKGEYLYRGIAARPFERRFNLADFVEVKGASASRMACFRSNWSARYPKSMKPRRIEIQAGQGESPPADDNVKTIEHSKVA